MRLALGVLLACLCNGVAIAQDETPRCFGLSTDSTAETLPDLGMGTVIGNGPSFFFRSIDPPCMSEPKSCRQPKEPYLVPGDRVVVITSAFGYRCVQYAKRTRSRSAGWMPSERIELDPPPIEKIPLQAWAGTWRDDSTTIKFAIRKNTLIVDGSAIWQGIAAIHTGELNSAGIPVGNTLGIGAAKPCQVHMLLSNNVLFAVDNGGCGGANVTFSGIYVHTAG